MMHHSNKYAGPVYSHIHVGAKGKRRVAVWVQLRRRPCIIKKYQRNEKPLNVASDLPRTVVYLLVNDSGVMNPSQRTQWSMPTFQFPVMKHLKLSFNHRTWKKWHKRNRRSASWMEEVGWWITCGEPELCMIDGVMQRKNKKIIPTQICTMDPGTGT